MLCRGIFGEGRYFMQKRGKWRREGKQIFGEENGEQKGEKYSEKENGHTAMTGAPPPPSPATHRSGGIFSPLPGLVGRRLLNLLRRSLNAQGWAVGRDRFP